MSLKVIVTLPSPDYHSGHRSGIEGVIGPFADDTAIHEYIKVRPQLDCGRGEGCCYIIHDLESPDDES